MRGRLRQLLRVGVDDRTPHGEVKHVLITNALACFGLLSALVFVSWAIAIGNSIGAVNVTGMALVQLATLHLNRTGRFQAARLTLGLGSLPLVAVAALSLGDASGAYLAVLLLLAGTPLAFPANRQQSMAFVLVVFLAGFILLKIAVVLAAPWVELGADVIVPVRWATEISVAVFLFAYGLYGHRQIGRAEERLEIERARADALLRNILPAEIAERLKEAPGTIAERFDDTTVLFADLAGFTPRAEHMTPAELVAMLDEVFSRFDVLVGHHGLEKIKTIGDAYMVVGGAPHKCAGHTEAVAALALDMLVELERPLTSPGAAQLGPLQLRIGIDCGPVVAGVIGHRKLAWDLWGDTVNTAARMEAHGEPGRVHVTDRVASRLKSAFTLESRGSIQVKGKGEMSTWFLAR